MSNRSDSQESVYIVDYTEKAIAVFGDTKVMKDHLSSLGGKFNPSLRGNNEEKKPGWIFPKTKRSEVQSLLDKIKNGEIDVSEPHPFESKAPQKTSKVTRAVDDNFIFSKEMYLSLVSRIEKLETELALTKKILFKNDSQSEPTRTQGLATKNVSSSRNTNLVFEDSENSEEEQEEKVPPRRLLNLKK